MSKILLDVDFKFVCPKKFMKLQIQEIVWIYIYICVCVFIQHAIIFECYFYFIHILNCYTHELQSVVQHRPWYPAGTGSHIAIIQNRILSILHAMSLLVSSCSGHQCQCL